MFAAGTNWLEKSAADIDALNVFPVPDGDTGTNMLLTMRSSLDEAYRVPNHHAAAIAEAMAKGALMGARGNSGVILSQIWRGLATAFAGKETFNGSDLAHALVLGSQRAYSGLSNPVEGTILTVIKEAAAAAQKRADGDSSDVIAIMEAAVSAASEAVANTPNLLKVLRDAGVVDAGGQGLYTLLEGALRYLRGEVQLMQFRKPQIIVSSATAARLPLIVEEPCGYCTEFLLKGEKLKPERMQKNLEKKGQSLIVVGDESTVRVHIHTLNPGGIISYATSLGSLHQISIRNMDEQHQDFLEMQKERQPVADTSIIAVVSGDGLVDIFRSLGIAEIVPGGQTMNPSTKDLLKGVESALSDKVIILPNNSNVVLTANQVQSLTKKHIKVVPTETIPQGVAAVLAFDYEADVETNTELMEKARSAVRSIEITRAIRSAQLDGLTIKRRQAIGFLDRALVAVDDEAIDVLNKTLNKIGRDKPEVITVYYGADVKQADAEEISANIRQRYPEAQIEVVRGGQPHYEYIISVE